MMSLCLIHYIRGSFYYGVNNRNVFKMCFNKRQMFNSLTVCIQIHAFSWVNYNLTVGQTWTVILRFVMAAYKSAIMTHTHTSTTRLITLFKNTPPSSSSYFAYYEYILKSKLTLLHKRFCHQYLSTLLRETKIPFCMLIYSYQDDTDNTFNGLLHCKDAHTYNYSSYDEKKKSRFLKFDAYK